MPGPKICHRFDERLGLANNPCGVASLPGARNLYGVAMARESWQESRPHDAGLAPSKVAQICADGLGLSCRMVSITLVHATPDGSGLLLALGHKAKE